MQQKFSHSFSEFRHSIQTPETKPTQKHKNTSLPIFYLKHKALEFQHPLYSFEQNLHFSKNNSVKRKKNHKKGKAWEKIPPYHNNQIPITIS